MLSREADFKGQHDQIRGAINVHCWTHGPRQTVASRMRRVGAACVLAVIGHTPAQAASGQAEFVCSESAATILRGSTTPVYQTRAEAVMVFDFDRKLVLHGEGSERYPIRKVEARQIAALRLPRDHAVPDRWRRASSTALWAR